jgi:SAM-dependent methyltransferase
MTPATADPPYPLGDTSAEHARLIRQAAIWDPFTERLFRDAGIGPGQRVLDIGSGVGDVAIVGVEREPVTIATARSRVAKAGLSNVSFLESDVRGVANSALFDAVVGRAILQYLPEAGAVLRLLATRVRPGGVIAFQDVWPASLFHLTAHLPLRSKCASLIYRTLQRSGVHMDMELVLTAPSWKPAFLLRASVSRFLSATIRTSYGGSTISFAPWRRAWTAELAISKRSNRGSRGKGSRRDHLPQASRSSAPILGPRSAFCPSRKFASLAAITAR